MTNYGSSTGVASYVTRYANSDGDFDSATRPTLDTVERRLVQVSAMVDSVLAQQGFDVPVTANRVRDILDGLVEQIVADWARYDNNAGRYGPSGKNDHLGLYGMIQKDIIDFLKSGSLGFDDLGAERSEYELRGISYRRYDESGDETGPWFQVKGFGNRWKNWDG